MSSTRYTVARSLGVGALSEALLARDEAGRFVVLKRLHRHLANDAACAEMFRHEARVLAALSHPCVARLAAPPEAPVVEFAQEFIAGASLAALMGAHAAPLPLDAAGEILARLLDALEHVHDRADAEGRHLAIVHRDVCPANVMVTREGRVALVDFGIATSAWRADPDRGHLKGTRGYMSPEAVTGERDADARSDLFAVGVILYELTVGRRLYEGPAVRVMAAIADGPLPSPARDAPGYPDALDRVARRALARLPEGRFASAADFREALRAALAAHGVAPSRGALAAALDAAFGALPRDAVPG